MRITRWALALLVLALAGCGTAAATAPGHPATTPAAHHTATAPAHRTAPAPARTPATQAPAAQAPSQHPLSGHPAGPSDLYPLGVVYRYYDDLNAHNYPDAWNNLGGSNIAAQNGQTYGSWVAGYSGVAGLYISGKDLGAYAGDHLVQVSITVTQKDGTVQHYAGTYTLRETDYQSWTILSASIHATSGSASPAAQPASGAAYWLANGGQWYVHGVQLQISQGPSGLTGTETWNEFANVVTGTAHLSFTVQANGGLAGTYTDDTTYTKTGDASQWLGPMGGEPQKGQQVLLEPIAPMHAQSVLGPDSPMMFSGGNLNWCQQGLADASQYCGA